MKTSSTIDAATHRSGGGRVSWGTAGDLPVARPSSVARPSCLGRPVTAQRLGERLHYDAPSRGFIRAVGSLVEQVLIVKPS